MLFDNGGFADGNTHRCFLYLVNYARIKPDVAVKALPILEEVSSRNELSECSYSHVVGYARLEPTSESIGYPNNVIYSCQGIRGGFRSADEAAPP